MRESIIVTPEPDPVRFPWSSVTRCSTRDDMYVRPGVDYVGFMCSVTPFFYHSGDRIELRYFLSTYLLRLSFLPKLKSQCSYEKFVKA